MLLFVIPLQSPTSIKQHYHLKKTIVKVLFSLREVDRNRLKFYYIMHFPKYLPDKKFLYLSISFILYTFC